MDNGKPDQLDIRIIQQLREDGRRATKEISNNLSVTEATVTSRIHGLNEAGVMRVMAQRNVAKMRHRLPCFLSIWVSGRDVDDVASDLATFNRVASVQILVGSPEIHVTAFVEESQQALAELQRDVGSVAGVNRLEVNIAFEIRTYRSEFATLGMDMSGADQIGDELDEMIVRQLHLDARISFREIGRILDVPASTVRERVNRMLQTEVIRIGAVCDPHKIGLNVGAFAYLRVDPARIDEALKHLESVPDMGEVGAVSGAHNVFVLMGARDYQHVVDIVKHKVERTPGVQKISIRMISHTKKHRPDLISIVPDKRTGGKKKPVD